MPLYSLEFIIFLSVVFASYWFFFKKSATRQNLLLTFSSLVFYGFADWRFLSLLIFTILFNFYIAKAIFNSITTKKRLLLYTGLFVNIAILGYFKYFNFFFENFIKFFAVADQHSNHSSLQIILPLGISFFTFQAIGYIVDVYNEDIKPCNSLLTFATFITYFPKMVAGPIERAEAFIHQTTKKRTFSYEMATDGLRQILWGLFVKLVISNNCAAIASPIFDNYLHLPASTLFIGAFFYVFQVYGDFSGYSNIAIGISKLFGIRLMRNFAAPFFSTNIRDYWKKWHISLSSWMMHYVFFPISFLLRKYHKTGLIFSIIITFLIIGLWHGANWTFIVFGMLHGLYFIPIILKGNINETDSAKNNLPLISVKTIFKMTALFFLIMLTLIFFGSVSVYQALHYLSRLFSPTLFSMPVYPELITVARIGLSLFFIVVLLSVEWAQKNKDHEMQINNIYHPSFRMGIYYTIVIAIFLFGSIDHINFLYSQF
jgi:D-alanyl-lipoteichoic acid acyltransferase DltB (MBOAT superfamily)